MASGRWAGKVVELIVVTLVLACLGGTWALIVRMYRRQEAESRPQTPKVVIVPPKPLPPAPKPIVMDDPTPPVLARLGENEANHREAAERAARRAEHLDRARSEAEAGAARWRRRESLVRAQISALENQAHRLEAEADLLAAERDALVAEREATRADLERKRTQMASASSFAVLPYKGTNGTWRRPIVIDCRDGQATLLPRGPSYGMLELSTALGMRSHPLTVAVMLAARAIERGRSAPDGAPVEPYVLFLVRPDGIRPYYEARARLEPLGIAYGYELADADWEVDVPEFDDPAIWGEVPARSLPRLEPTPTGDRPGGMPPSSEAWLREAPDRGHASEDGGMPPRDKPGSTEGFARTTSGRGSPSFPGLLVEPRPDRPLELVIACGPSGLTIHPGGHRLSPKALDQAPEALPRLLRSIFHARQAAEPDVTVRPEVRFLVEPGGQSIYWSARRRTALAGLGWPTSLRVAEASPIRAFQLESRR